MNLFIHLNYDTEKQTLFALWDILCYWDKIIVISVLNFKEKKAHFFKKTILNKRFKTYNFTCIQRFKIIGLTNNFLYSFKIEYWFTFILYLTHEKTNDIDKISKIGLRTFFYKYLSKIFDFFWIDYFFINFQL